MKNGNIANSQPAIHLRLSLIENSYSFLNQSLKHYKKASRDVRKWPFAMLHLTQSIELMLKQRLYQIHPLFVFEDIDHPKNTVSLEQALGRLEAVGVVVGEKEKVSIRRATLYRNRVVHYEVELNKFEWKNNYAQLFEFVHFFHVKHFERELHTSIMKENHAVEARLMTYFKENFVVYHNVEMHKDNPRDIVQAQRIRFFVSGRRKYERFRYGDPLEGWGNGEVPCFDCGVLKGQYHAERCDIERCPQMWALAFGLRLFLSVQLLLFSLRNCGIK